MSQDTNDLIIERPQYQSDLKEDVAYTGEIVSIEKRKLPSQYHPKGERQAIQFEVVLNHSGDTTRLFYAPSLTWSKKGKLYKLLSDLGHLPDVGQTMNFNKLIGIKVNVFVYNVQRDGAVFSNIYKMIPLDEDTPEQDQESTVNGKDTPEPQTKDESKKKIIKRKPLLPRSRKLPKRQETDDQPSNEENQETDPHPKVEEE